MVRGKKRKAAEEEQPTAKRKRVNEREATPKRSGKAKPQQKEPVSPPKPQGKVRESGRVKEFPAGNLATSGSRMAFLRSLCSLPKFRSMVNLILPMVRLSSSINVF